MEFYLIFFSSGPIFALVLFLALLLVFWFGRSTAKRRRAKNEGGAGLIEAALFALLGLLLAFQVNGAANRLETRRSLVMQEANAVGTLWLRTELLPPEPREEVRRLVREWFDARLESRTPRQPLAKSLEIVQRARELQPEIWRIALEACRDDPQPSTTMLLLPSMNEMFDTGASRDVAALTHAPLAMFSLLAGVMILGTFLAGLASGRGPPIGWIPGISFAAALTVTMLVLLDMEFPRRGVIQIGPAETALLEARDAMEAALPVESPP